MFEKYEKFWVLAIIALAIYYFYKKGKPAQQGAVMEPGTEFYANVFGSLPRGSIVNPVTEPGSVQPAQASMPVLFKPAQPSGVPISQIVSAGQFQWYPAPPVLRTAPADYSGTIYGGRQYAA